MSSKHFSRDLVKRAGHSISACDCVPEKRSLSRDAKFVVQRSGTVSPSEIKDAFKRASSKMKTA
jgi:hypothetical protein